MAMTGDLAVLRPSAASSWGSMVPSLPDRACLAAEFTH